VGRKRWRGAREEMVREGGGRETHALNSCVPVQRILIPSSYNLTPSSWRFNEQIATEHTNIQISTCLNSFSPRGERALFPREEMMILLLGYREREVVLR
jgi:hypothetical protein